MSDRFFCGCANAKDFLEAQADDSIDLLFTSPPYEAARTYGIGFAKSGEDWVKWMIKIVEAAAPKVKGLIAINCEGQTRDYDYSGVPFLLFADLKRAGFNMRKPAVFHRVGIPGSGGPDWLRNDWEPIICLTRPGSLPWSDNTACGMTPKWAPGGEMSHRLSDGTKRNQWGGGGKSTGGERGVDGNLKVNKGRPSHFLHTKKDGTQVVREKRQVIVDQKDGMKEQCQVGYTVPVKANPGNVLKFNVGGGQMGHVIAHRNEAPFPLGLAEFFVKSFCPPNGVVCDPFSGSGTTAHAAIENGRRFVGCDIRQSQVDLTKRRLRTVTPNMCNEIESLLVDQKENE